MNKKLITLAVAAAMVAPLAAAAETTLYGRIDTALTYVDNDTDGAVLDDDGIWDIDTGTTRIGVKGSEDLGNGLQAIFNAEWQFTSSEGGSNDGTSTFLNRLAYAGLSGGFGTVAIGRQWTPYYGAVDKTDIFNDPGNAGTGPNTVAVNKAYLGLSRTGDALAYVSPNFNGFQAKLALVIDHDTTGATKESDGIDAYNPAITYDNGPISIGASLLDYDNDLGAQDRWGVAGSYNFGMFKLIAQYEDMDESDNTNNNDGADEWSIAGEAYFGNNTVRALYGNVDYDSGNATDELDVWAVSLQHNFSARTRVYAEYAANDYDFRAATDQDRSMFSLGLRHDF